tara:strand:+ start:1196 stop:1432 length:237 start_codon:yes stop_codon:yes gene_type:complete
MRLTNKQTGISFRLTPVKALDFFNMKNDKGEYINQLEEYFIDYNENCKEISTFRFFLGMIGILVLAYACFYLFLQWNY